MRHTVRNDYRYAIIFYNSQKRFLDKKTEFYSDLKESAVNDDNYENSKYLYHTLKIRH